MKLSRDDYDREFTRVNASWAYENNALSNEEKEQVYDRLSEEALAPEANSQTKKTGGKAMSSEYCYPESNVLINHFDIRSQELLDRAERYHTAFRAMEMRIVPIKANFDLEHLKTIHYQLFQDVYPFAGQIRHLNISKNKYWFCDTAMIPRLADQVFSELKTDRYLKGLPAEKFAEKAAYYYTEINFMHPFREGNGRVIREFFGQLAKGAGYELDWQEVPKEEYFRAVKQTDDPRQRQELVVVFEKCLKPITQTQQQEIQWKTPEQPMKLRDVLKVTEGLPTPNAKIETADLNKYVDQFLIDNKGTSVKVKFRDETKLRNIPLEKHPFLSAVIKNQILDLAAAGTQQTAQLSNFMELGG